MATPVTGITEIQANDPNAYLIHNQGIRHFEALISPVEGVPQNTPPGSPTDGEVYLVGDTPTGDWLNQQGKIAVVVNGNYQFYTPIDGLVLPLKVGSTAFIQYTQGTNSWGEVSGSYNPPTTTKGDLIVDDGTITDRLPVGTNGQILSANSLVTLGVEWIDNPSFNSPLTTVGDLLVFNGTTEVRLPVGTNGQALVADSGETTGVAWQTIVASLPTSSKGQIIVHDGTTEVALPISTDGYILSLNSATTEGVEWIAPPSGGGSLPTTTKGDLIAHNGTTDIRLPVGTDGQVLQADSAQSSGLVWATPSGGGGGAIVQDTAPSSPTIGQVWIETSGGGVVWVNKWTWDGTYWRGVEFLIEDVDFNVATAFNLSFSNAFIGIAHPGRNYLIDTIKAAVDITPTTPTSSDYIEVELRAQDFSSTGFNPVLSNIFVPAQGSVNSLSGDIFYMSHQVNFLWNNPIHVSALVEETSRTVALSGIASGNDGGFWMYISEVRA